MLYILLIIFRGKAAWKYFPSHKPPQPIKQLSEEHKLAGFEHSSYSIKDTQL